MSSMMRLLTIMMMIMMMVTVIRAEIHEPTTSAADPHTAFYNILPKEGLDPPGRPNFQPIYDEQDLVRSRHNDKSRLVQKREAEKSTETQRVTKTESIVSVKKGESDSDQGHRDLNTGDSNFELRLPSFAEPPQRRPGGRPNERPRPHRPGRGHNKRGPRPKSASRRQSQVYSDYDPRSEQSAQPRSGGPGNIFPIPVEFLQQISGPGQPGKFRPGQEFSPSAQIEELGPGTLDSTVREARDSVFPRPEEGIQPTLFTLEEGVTSSQPVSRSLPPGAGPATSHSIFREEYPSPPSLSQNTASLHAPYSQVPYHDARVTTPGPRERVLHYMAPPNQALNYGVPPVIVDSTPQPPPGPHHHHQHGGGATLKTGYFPPETRVMPRVSHIEAECRDDVMKLRVAFNDTFAGLIYSAGYTHDHDCMYINGTGQNTYEFYIQLNRCGTLGGSDHHKREVKNRNPTKNYMWNTITIQYNPLIEEEWDEHFKITCEYGYDFWKTVTFPFLEVETNTADPVVFTLTPPECFMEIRSGYGLGGNRIAGPVHVGDPITLLVYMRSQWDGFDILVNDCYAHNGANKKIQLIDHHGCPEDDKLISKFQGTLAQRDSMYETVIYAHMKTFRFTGTPALYIECDIRMCHGSCPVQPCSWREQSAQVKRRRRSVASQGSQGNITNVEEEEPADLDNSEGNKNSSFSESLRLFQSIQVLANEEESAALRNETAEKVLVEAADYCFSSMMFTSMAGLVTVLFIMSGLSITLLCTRLKRRNKESKESAADVVHNTLRSRHRSEYVHSPQARIP